MKPAQSPRSGEGTKRFSLVPALAQQQMYKALAALKPANLRSASGAEVAEIAICLALGENDPVILASDARGARAVRKRKTIPAGKPVKGGRLRSATVTAVAALISGTKATALVCAGRLDGEAEAREDYGSAFGFAVRHKLPIIYLVANRFTEGRKQELDLRTLHSEFGVPVFSLDANDAIAAYRIATEALHNARHMRGPCVVEALSIHGKSRSAGALELLREYMDRHGNWPL